MENPGEAKARKEMRTVVITMLMIGAVISGMWGYWGMFTKEGNHKYDEMDGIYPFMGLVGAVILTFIAAIVLIIPVFTRKKRL